MTPAAAQVAPTVRGRSRALLWRLARKWLGLLGLISLLVIALSTLIGPFFAADPLRVTLPDRLLPPGSADHLLGTDALGRDILARVLDGGRVSLLVAVVSSIVALIPAMLIGMTAGYFRGVVDEVLSRFFDVLLTFPSLLLALIVVAALGPSLPSIIVAVGVGYIARYGRLFRALTLETREREFVAAATALGYSHLRIALVHILPNILLPVFVIAAGNMGRIAIAEASLSFLGAGIQAPNASWGNMMAEGQPYLQYYPWLAVVPGLVLTVLTVSFGFLGDGLRDVFDIKDTSRQER